MEKSEIKQILEKVRKESPKRKFLQSIDYILSLKDIDLKKIENQKEFFVILRFPPKVMRVCTLIGPELLEQSKKTCDLAISSDNFDKYAKDKKETKKLAQEYDFFIAQANIMSKVAASFGRVLGPRGKMPNPKAGCVVPPNTNLNPLVERLKKTVKISIKKDPLFMCKVGTEKTPDDHIIDNIYTLYNAIIHNLPKEKHNIKTQYLKTTMGPAIQFGKESKEDTQKKKKIVEKKKTKEEKEDPRAKDTKKNLNQKDEKKKG